MAVKKLIEVWDGINLVDENINFLKQKTKQVRIPFNENSHFFQNTQKNLKISFVL